jgi:hypothetical protein
VSYRVQFELTGDMPLLMHWDNIEGGDTLKEWRQDPANKNNSVAGDDRSPAWTWHTYVYNDGEFATVPQDNVMASLMHGGMQVPPWWKTKKQNVKELTQSGIIPASEHFRFEYGKGQQLSIAKLNQIRSLSFAKQAEAAQGFGFRLFCKRATVGMSKHVRVRPRFEQWKVTGELHVIADNLPIEKLELIFFYAGRSGLCDWRPSSPKRPGPYGMFSAKLKEIKSKSNAA